MLMLRWCSMSRASSTADKWGTQVALGLNVGIGCRGKNHKRKGCERRRAAPPTRTQVALGLHESDAESIVDSQESSGDEEKDLCKFLAQRATDPYIKMRKAKGPFVVRGGGLAGRCGCCRELGGGPLLGGWMGECSMPLWKNAQPSSLCAAPADPSCSPSLTTWSAALPPHFRFPFPPAGPKALTALAGVSVGITHNDTTHNASRHAVHQAPPAAGPPPVCG